MTVTIPPSVNIPESCTVLVIGGGPSGSYTASVLAREGIDTVLLESETLPRYHVGESLLPSMKYFLKFVDAEKKFDQHGFVHKNGATFKFNSKKPGWTDFLAAGGPENYSWNVVRSEADHILFKHAGECGAQVFDETKVTGIEFENGNEDISSTDKPVSASWSRKMEGRSGTIRFQYLVDASGRAGLVSTKYKKTRKYNQGLKNSATWGYWKHATVHGPGVGDPYFEALQDGTGWVWYIPLHNDTTSVGVVMRQDQIAPKKKACGSTSSLDFYKKTLNEVPGVARLLETAQLQEEDLKTASDWSYSASEYASPNLRIAGDAGCFIDPLFSSGVHLAMNSGLSAATTICASMRGHCTEEEAIVWHSKKVAEGYTRFLLVVTSSLQQIQGREAHILSEVDEAGFDNAFDHFRPVIQGTIEAGGNLTREEIAESVNFCTNVLSKIENGADLPETNPSGERGAAPNSMGGNEKGDAAIMKIFRTNRVLDLETFKVDVINGFAPNMERGNLGLVAAVGA